MGERSAASRVDRFSAFRYFLQHRGTRSSSLSTRSRFPDGQAVSDAWTVGDSLRVPDYDAPRNAGNSWRRLVGASIGEASVLEFEALGLIALSAADFW